MVINLERMKSDSIKWFIRKILRIHNRNPVLSKEKAMFEALLPWEGDTEGGYLVSCLQRIKPFI